MDDERSEWLRVEAILDEALDLPPDEREALLLERCGDDDQLRARVARLLAACASSRDHFETPPSVPAQVFAGLRARGVGTTPGEPGGEPPEGAGGRDRLTAGDVVGAYEIVELLGRGGMGVVYRARRADGAFDRMVALKVVKRGMDTDEILARFHQERAILARLQHPSIATLLDGGVTATGLPYFVMELVQGEPIDQWCIGQQPDLRARIRLFLQVCDAVAYAHRSLVVHRDLKPSNIFVLPDGQPKLLDFGIAKLLQDEGLDGLTAVAGARLTPDYAAPEQVLGQPTTTAADVYALGVILYELLAGSRPYRAEGSVAEVERQITRGAVALPSRTAPSPVARQLRGDLDAIVMKAMSKEPERRFASVEALSQDLTRFLEGRTVEARPDSLGYRVRKFVARNRLPVGLGLAAGLALVAGAVSSSVLAYVADRERAQREVEAERARAARDFVVDLFAGLDPEQLEGRTTFTRDEIVALGIRNLDDLEGQPTLRAGVLNTLGQVALNLGDGERAEELFREAYRILEGEAESVDRAASMMGLGEVFRARLDFAQAEDWLVQAVELQQRILPEDDVRLIEARAALAFALFNQGSDRFDEADAVYAELLSSDPPPPVRGDILTGFANLRLGQDRPGQAEALYQQAVEERVAATGRKDADVARALWGVGHARMGQGAAAEAVTAYRESLEILERIYGARHGDVAWAHYNLGGGLYATDSIEAAAAAFGQAARLMEALNPPGYLYTAFAWQRLGQAQEELDRHADAEGSYRAAIRIYEAASAGGGRRDPGRTATLYRSVARMLAARRLEERAIEALHQGLASLEPDQFPGVAAGLTGDLAEIFDRLGQADSTAFYEARTAAIRGEGVTGR